MITIFILSFFASVTIGDMSAAVWHLNISMTLRSSRGCHTTRKRLSFHTSRFICSSLPDQAPPPRPLCSSQYCMFSLLVLVYYRMCYIKTGDRFDLLTHIQRPGSDCAMLEHNSRWWRLMPFFFFIPHFNSSFHPGNGGRHKYNGHDSVFCFKSKHR